MMTAANDECERIEIGKVRMGPGKSLRISLYQGATDEIRTVELRLFVDSKGDGVELPTSRATILRVDRLGQLIERLNGARNKANRMGWQTRVHAHVARTSAPGAGE